MNESKIIDGLNDLLAKNYDAEKGFMKAADETENRVLAALYREKASQRYTFGHQIKDILREMGGEIDKGTSTLGDMHRAWMNFKKFFSFDKEEAILEEIENGEEAAVKEYNEFLEISDLPHSIRRIITAQRNAIQKTLDKVEQLEETYD
ncbi:ferritin-like domain-containing protein [Portibacter marinus]|uniref:ferritin-like domain-containing protein n=1 Tax=Portibacter marinus TaxID=2898660 RepID=UPI001F1BDB7C|nr:PA2169 family four-helix-bundle protein [Portibacter marinus]